MILDSTTQLSAEQAVTATAISTNVIDLQDDRDIGAGEPVYLLIKVDTDCDSAADGASVAFTLESDSTADLATSATTHVTVAAIGEASLTAGTVVAKIALPIDSYERYLGVRYTVSGENLTAGAFSAYITKDVSAYTNYPNNYTITSN